MSVKDRIRRLEKLLTRRGTDHSDPNRLNGMDKLFIKFGPAGIDALFERLDGQSMGPPSERKGRMTN